jgi:hypothetical protein
VGFTGPQPLSWPDMAVWASLSRTSVSAAEWAALRAIDQAYLAAWREWTDRDKAEVSAPHIYSEQPMTPELFDAIF